jgi:hypothetical protein
MQPASDTTQTHVAKRSQQKCIDVLFIKGSLSDQSSLVGVGAPRVEVPSRAINFFLTEMRGPPRTALVRGAENT